MQADEALEKSKFRTAVEAYLSALEVVPDHDLHNIKLNMGLCKALVQLGRGKDALTRCSLVLEMDESSLEALEQVLDTITYLCRCSISPLSTIWSLCTLKLI